jgi:hypothetical protein
MRAAASTQPLGAFRINSPDCGVLACVVGRDMVFLALSNVTGELEVDTVVEPYRIRPHD